MVEQWTFNPLVQGSSPWGGTGTDLGESVEAQGESDLESIPTHVVHVWHRHPAASIVNLRGADRRQIASVDNRAGAVTFALDELDADERGPNLR